MNQKLDAKKVCTFYIVRHGESEGNVRGILQGHADMPLTENGIRQAAERSSMLKEIEFADAFSSDLFRARKTAEIIAADHDLTVKTTQLLRERNFGAYNGVPIDTYKHELHDLLEYRESLSESEKMSMQFGKGIETEEATSERLLQFVRTTAFAYPGKNVLIVSHGGVIRSTLVRLGWASYDSLPPNAISNAGLVVLQSDGIEFWIEQVDGVSLEQRATNAEVKRWV